jgi:hypothetical protein
LQQSTLERRGRLKEAPLRVHDGPVNAAIAGSADPAAPARKAMAVAP